MEGFGVCSCICSSLAMLTGKKKEREAGEVKTHVIFGEKSHI